MASSGSAICYYAICLKALSPLNFSSVNLLAVAMTNPHFSPRLCRGVAFGEMLPLGKCSPGNALLGGGESRSATPRQSRGLKLRLGRSRCPNEVNAASPSLKSHAATR